MKAMIFAAGLGTRLYPITESIPKAMVEVGGVPMLRRVIEKLKAIGVNEMVINVHHFADKIIDYLHSNNGFGVEIHISDERDLLLDTGGGILAARRWLDGDELFIVHNADILTDFSLKDMLSAQRNGQYDATLLVSGRTTSRYLLFDNTGRMAGWKNSKTGEVRPAGLDDRNLQCAAFGGVHVMSPSVFPALEKYSSENGRVFSITPFYISECGRLNIHGYRPFGDYAWFDIGKPETLESARSFIEKQSKNIVD